MQNISNNNRGLLPLAKNRLLLREGIFKSLDKMRWQCFHKMFAAEEWHFANNFLRPFTCPHVVELPLPNLFCIYSESSSRKILSRSHYSLLWEYKTSTMNGIEIQHTITIPVHQSALNEHPRASRSLYCTNERAHRMGLADGSGPVVSVMNMRSICKAWWQSSALSSLARFPRSLRVPPAC